jgi:hypothetical protein
VSVTYRQIPLKGHSFALPAARIAECAGNQGRFEPMHDQLFEGQKSFWLRPWSEYATAAGATDFAAFETSINKTDPIPRVVEDQALGKERDVPATLTVIASGWKLGHPPTEQEFGAMVTAVLPGKARFRDDASSDRWVSDAWATAPRKMALPWFLACRWQRIARVFVWVGTNSPSTWHRISAFFSSVRLTKDWE